MKFYSIKSKLSFVLASLAIASTLSAQESVFSPYSRFGIGELRSLGNAQHFSLSESTVGALNKDFANLLNPSSFAYLKKPSLDGYFTFTSTQLKNTNSTQTINTGAIGSMNIIMPFGKGFSGALRLQPLSTVSYSATSTATVDSLNVTHRYEGRGGTNTASMDFAYNFFNKKDSTYLALGVSPTYIFGNILHLRSSEFNEANTQNSRNTQKTSLSDLSLNFSASFGFYRGKHHFFSLGASYNPETKINRKYSNLTQNYIIGGFDNTILKDTVRFDEGSRGQLILPQKFSFGMAYAFKSRWRINASYSSQEWSQLGEVNDGEFTSYGTSNQNTLALGLSFTPSNRESFNESVFNQSHYYLGAKQSRGYLSVNNMDLVENSVSAGLSLPLRRSGTGSFIHIGTVFGTRGDKSLLQESFWKFNIGLSIKPKYVDQWFRKRKYN